MMAFFFLSENSVALIYEKRASRQHFLCGDKEIGDLIEVQRKKKKAAKCGVKSTNCLIAKFTSPLPFFHTISNEDNHASLLFTLLLLSKQPQVNIYWLLAGLQKKKSIVQHLGAHLGPPFIIAAAPLIVFLSYDLA